MAALRSFDYEPQPTPHSAGEREVLADERERDEERQREEWESEASYTPSMADFDPPPEGQL